MAMSAIRPNSTTHTPDQHHYFKPAPAEISYGKMRFLITDRPTNFTLSHYIQELKKHNCHDVVRVCEPTYTIEPLKKEGIEVVDWEFPDGSPPPQAIKEKWLHLVKTRFKEDPGCCIAVHCVAGLGRAPVLVALSLMEAGMKYEDAVELIREHRRGAINKKQLEFLESYRPDGCLKKLKRRSKERDEVISDNADGSKSIRNGTIVSRQTHVNNKSCVIC